MHSVSHQLAHRGPGATRARARWQPYTSPSPSRSVPVNYLNTPSSSVSSSPPQSTHASSICDFTSISSSSSVCHVPKDFPPRDAQKTKYVTGLVDQAVKSLCDIWHPHEIPQIFLTSARVPFCTTQDSIPPPTPTISHTRRNVQLPSPISPTTQFSPFSTSPTSSCSQTSSSSADPCASLPSSQATSNLVPMKGFVHEVLRRSRTSGCVLQTALCYLEAIRSKVPKLVQQEKSGEGVSDDKELDSRIVRIEDLLEEVDHTQSYASPDSIASEDSDTMDTVRIQDGCGQPQSHDPFAQSQVPSTSNPAMIEGLAKKPKGPSAPLPPLPALPSPLLCPRRTFLASLILASKFMQDRCYSNRAWAKLSGLPPREIGRCERALGDALEWRLWVGKMPVRTLTKSKSDGDLSPNKRYQAPARNLGPTMSPLTLASQDVPLGVPSLLRMPASMPISVPPRTSSLRRSATLPALRDANASSYFNQDVLRAPSFAPPPVPDLASLDPTPLGVAATTFSLYGAIGGPSPPWTMPPPSSSSYPVQYLPNTHSPSPPTPTLSFSPSSSSTCSDSSSEGERTIQMTTFTDADVQTPMPHCPSLLGYGYPYPSQFADKPSVSPRLPAVQSSSYGYGDVSTLSFDGFRTTDGGDSSNYFIPTGGVSDYASIVGGRMYC